MRRFLTGTGAAFALSLVLAVGSASAKTVYDYVYSGSYIDGSTAGSTFSSGLGGIVYDRHAHQLLVGHGGTPGRVSKYTLSGAAANFTALGAPFFTVEPSLSGETQIAVDQSEGATDGRFYMIGGGFSGAGFGAYNADGTSRPWKEIELENLCGVGVPGNGEEITTAARVGLNHYNLEGERTSSDYVGPEGFEPGVKIRAGERNRPCRLVFDNNGDIYGVKVGFGFGSSGPAVKVSPTGLEYYELNHNEHSQSVAVDYSNNDVFVLNSFFSSGSFELFDEDGRLLGTGWGEPDPEHSYEGITKNAVGITVDPATHDVFIANKREYASGVTHIEKFIPTNPHVIPDTTATKPGYVDPVGEHMLLKGVVNADGVETTNCHFEYGTNQELGTSVPCEQGNNFSGNEDHVVSAEIATEKGVRYYYKLFAKNGNEQEAPSNYEHFIPQGLPKLPGFLGVDRVNTDGVRFSTEFDPNGGNASYHFEWGVKGNGFEGSTPESKTYGFVSNPGLFNGENTYLPGIKHVSTEVTGLQPGITYEYRVVVTNEAGSVQSQIQEFTTYVPDSGIDNCSNAQVRQQTEASLLPDCRAYELVSAANQGGYDVESDLVAGQTPLDAYPRAAGRLLYSLHFGVIPGISGSPTNLGNDPYVATRGEDGWATKYVGLPSNGMADGGAFGSPLLGADSALKTFAFGGEDICEPCFEDGSTNIPLRLPNGELVKGMQGSLPAVANPAGYIGKSLSADGSHLVFGSTTPLQPDGHSSEITIYDRNLATKQTHVVSKTTSGETMKEEGEEIGELDISNDGSRILFGTVVDEEGGNKLWHLYMNVGDSPTSIDVTPGTTSGVLYDGMTADGSKVFFTTRDPLASQNNPQDGDTSADLFRADVGTTGPVTLTRISTGSEGTGNSDECEPVANWNLASGGPDCSVVPLAGGAGVASGDGTVYFISPEQLDGSGNGTPDQPNLYVEKPEASTPTYVGEIDSSLGKPGPQPPSHPVISTNFITGLKFPEGMAVDQETGAIYVAETGSGGRIARFDSSGAPLKFTEGEGAGTNEIPNSGLYETESGIAVDDSGGPFHGAIYAIHGTGAVAVYSRNGLKLGELTGFSEACGVAVNQNTGELFVGDWSFGGIRRFTPISGTTPVSKADYEETGLHTQGQNPCHVGADTAGHAFAVSWSTGPLKKYNVSDFSASPETKAGTEVAGTSLAVSSDPLTGDLFNDEGNKIVEYDPAGNEVGSIGSSASLGSTSNGVAVNGATKTVYALNGSKVVEFGYEEVPYEPINNPAILHGVNQAETHHYEDFQVSPDGRYAAFSSPVALTGYQNLGHYEVYRYDTESESLDCASCAPSNAVGEADVKLSPHGLNLTDNGRVFFTTLQSLALRDTNEKKDAYEWNGKPGLISSGIGQDDSALVTVSANGTDAFFFTRDKLVPTDQNGNVVKVYDARAGGGFLYDPARLRCAASDECHGAGTESPPPPNINSGTGPEHAFPPVTGHRKRCRKGRVLRHRRCVPKKRHRRHKRHTTRRHG